MNNRGVNSATDGRQHHPWQQAGTGQGWPLWSQPDTQLPAPSPPRPPSQQHQSQHELRGTGPPLCSTPSLLTHRGTPAGAWEGQAQPYGLGVQLTSSNSLMQAGLKQGSVQGKLPPQPPKPPSSPVGMLCGAALGIAVPSSPALPSPHGCY